MYYFLRKGRILGRKPFQFDGDNMLLKGIGCGKKVRVMAVDAGRKLQAHLAAMGLVPGVELEVINAGSRGPCIVSIGGRRLILGHGMIHKIIVA